MIFPDFLKPDDKVGIIAPAGAINYPEDIQKGVELLSKWGLLVIEGYTVSRKHFQFAGSDEERCSDLQYMLDHPEIKAILAVRGGYGCSRIIDQLDFSSFKKHPKWIVGFSDITVLLHHVQTLGYAAIHGPMVKQLGTAGSESASESLNQILFGEIPEYVSPPHSLNRIGQSSGMLSGGNLCLLAHQLGSASEVDTTGKILFLEDVGEELYNLDRMLWQLQRAGKLKNLEGLIVGQFTENKGNPAVFGQDAYDIISQHVRAYHYPVAYDFPAGHVADNRPLILGASATLKVDENGAMLSTTCQK